MVSYLISGTSRGIGLALTERLAKENQSNAIYAGARTPESAEALQALVEKYSGQIKIVQLDPTNQASVDAAVKHIEDTQGSLDVLINNAGVSAGGLATVPDMDLKALQDNIDVNVTGVARLTNAALPLLRKAPTRLIAIISSQLGSAGFAVNSNFALAAAYSVSKSAATMLGVQYGVTLKPEDFKVKIIHPGWVQTDMGGEGADLTVEESVEGIVGVLSAAKTDDPIALLRHDGSVMPF